MITARGDDAVSCIGLIATFTAACDIDIVNDSGNLVQYFRIWDKCRCKAGMNGSATNPFGMSAVDRPRSARVS